MPNPKSIGLLLFSLLTAASPSLAQTPAPTPAPVPVREEPCHRVVFENDYVRVIDVHVPPGVTTLYHIHSIPSVVVELTNSSIISQEFGQPPPAPRKVAPGETRYAPYDVTPLTHRVTNQGTEVFHVMDIELVKPNTADRMNAVVPVPGLKLAWEKNLARSFAVQVAAGQSCDVPAGNYAHLLIGIAGRGRAEAGADGQFTKRPIDAGEFIFLPARTSIRLTPLAKDDCTCVLLELR